VEYWNPCSFHGWCWSIRSVPLQSHSLMPKVTIPSHLSPSPFCTCGVGIPNLLKPLTLSRMICWDEIALIPLLPK
jgi:hypothetical protein